MSANLLLSICIAPTDVTPFPVSVNPNANIRVLSGWFDAFFVHPSVSSTDTYTTSPITPQNAAPKSPRSATGCTAIPVTSTWSSRQSREVVLPPTAAPPGFISVTTPTGGGPPTPVPTAPVFTSATMFICEIRSTCGPKPVPGTPPPQSAPPTPVPPASPGVVSTPTHRFPTESP